MRPLLLLLSLGILTQATAAVFTVGPTGDYPTPNALYLADVIDHGDTLLIEAGEYVGTEALAVWQKNDLLIMGVGGRPHLRAAGQYIWGKGIWVVAGNNVTVEHLEFSEAAVPDQNGAGIRLDGVGLTVRHCYFHQNENGILTANPGTGKIVIEFSEFDDNGHGDGFSHNLYVGRIDSLIFRYNYSHHARVGHQLKTRARVNLIAYNRIMDEGSGASSRLIDVSNGGETTIVGNLLMQGPMAINNNLIGYGKEGLTPAAEHACYVYHNTMVNKRTASGLFIDVNDATPTVHLVNNYLVGTGVFQNGPLILDLGNVFVEQIADAHLRNEADYDYRLLPQAPAVDEGAEINFPASPVEAPELIYVHPLGFAPRLATGSSPDAGAYELESPSSLQASSRPVAVRVYPNPARHWLTFIVEENVVTTCVIGPDGQRHRCRMDNRRLSLLGLAPGTYELLLEGESGRWYRARFVVQ